MTDESLITRLLVNKSSRVKALVVYEIRQLECRLKCFLFSDSLDEAVVVCQSLRQRYDEYRQVLCSDDAEYLSYNVVPSHCHVWRDCYLHIELLTHQLFVATSSAEEMLRVNDLCWHYGHFCSLLNGSTTKWVQETEDVALCDLINLLVQAGSPMKWLAAMVRFANQSETMRTETLTHLTKLNDQQLLHLCAAFSHPEYTPLIRAIFVYKLHPDDLFNEELHPEKLISVKIRLSLLYAVIEMLHQEVTHRLLQIGLHPALDYLLHSEELPPGIEITITNDCRDIIQSVVKSWHVNVIIVNEEEPHISKVHEMLHAYKFWFNPNRLIDATMLLQQRLANQDSHIESNDCFYQQMLQLYHQLTTTSCLDLYGYFSNKDTCYLMRTLSAVDRGVARLHLPTLTSLEKNAIKRVYNALECVMNALRDELSIRCIITVPYRRDLTAKVISPSRRNWNAVSRVIALYGKETVTTTNTKIEKLFEAVEAYETDV